MSFILAANWKMNKNPKETEEFFSDLLLQDWNNSLSRVFFVPAVNLVTTSNCLKGSSVQWGPQNIYSQESGAFTGENSPKVMADIGAQFALVGHSERRSLFGETDEQTCLKIKALQEFSISPILCIGETLDERKSGKTLEVLKRQLSVGLSGVELKKELHIAYEPVWAIGTGEVATVEQVAEAHQSIREFLKNNYPNEENNMQILYGGSVKAASAGELSQVKEVGGFLVGGASLKVDSFCDIAKAVLT